MARALDIQGHRGARALFPENTLEGFLAAFALGVTAFELDVGMTADGIVVVSHDTELNPDLTRTSSGLWLRQPGPAIHSLAFAALRTFDVGRLRPGSRTASLFPLQVPHDGARIPTLASVLAALPAARFTIEIKTDPANPNRTAKPAILADATLAVIDATGSSSRVIVESFDWRVQRHIRAARPDIRMAWLTSAETNAASTLWWDGIAPGGSVADQVAREGGQIWAPEHTSLTENQIKRAHSLGLSVLPWTVNHPDDMRRLVALGVDGLISDRPDLVHRVVSGTDTDASSTSVHGRDPDRVPQ